MTLSRRSAIARIATFAALGVLPRRLWGEALDPTPLAHPDPRPGITSEKVLSEEALAKKRQSVRDAYAAARAHPELFDGVACGCECSKSMGHRSLLSCFESEQPIGCAACREEGELVGRLAKAGKDLAAIRKAVDEEYG